MIVEVLFLLFFIGLFFLLVNLLQKIAVQSKINEQQAKDLQEIKERVLLANQLQDNLKDGLEKTKEEIKSLTRDLLEEVRKRDEIRKEKEREFLERIKRMDEILAGTSAKGLSGEEILAETFKKLPPEMIETNFKVGGKVVEFALILPNGKRIPIDSKWPATNLLLKLEKEQDQEKRREIIDEIEREVISRIKEVKQYIDPNLTWSQAIAALPDSVFGVCKKAHLKAREENIILIPYSMVLPLLLYMYRLHLQYSISVDWEKLQSHLLFLEKLLDQMENILENKVYRGATMVSNAYQEYKQILASFRSSLVELKGQKDLKKLK
jgi:DNA recombination protein RmuC